MNYENHLGMNILEMIFKTQHKGSYSLKPQTKYYWNFLSAKMCGFYTGKQSGGTFSANQLFRKLVLTTKLSFKILN